MEAVLREQELEREREREREQEYMTALTPIELAREAHRWFSEFAKLIPENGSGDARVPMLVRHLGVALAALAEAQQAHQWQPIETAPKRRDVYFWIVPKTAEESYADTSGKPIVTTFEPHVQFCKLKQWSALSKAIYWMERRLPLVPGAAPVTGETT